MRRAAASNDMSTRNTFRSSAASPLLLLLLHILWSSFAAPQTLASKANQLLAPSSIETSRHQNRTQLSQPESRGTDTPREPHLRERYTAPADLSQREHGKRHLVARSSAPSQPPPPSPMSLVPGPWIQHLVEGQAEEIELYRSQHMRSQTQGEGAELAGYESSSSAAEHLAEDSGAKSGPRPSTSDTARHTGASPSTEQSASGVDVTSSSPAPAAMSRKRRNKRTPPPACRWVLDYVREELQSFGAANHFLVNDENPFVRFWYTMEALHAAVEIEHDDKVWEHIWPEDWDTMWTPAERDQGVESVIAPLLLLCEESVLKYKLSGDTLLSEGWVRLEELLHECEPEVRWLIRRGINDWLEFRGEERQLKTREEQCVLQELEGEVLVDESRLRKTGYQAKAVMMCRFAMRTGAWCTLLHALLTYITWLVHLYSASECALSTRDHRTSAEESQIPPANRMLHTVHGFCRQLYRHSLLLADYLTVHQEVIQEVPLLCSVVVSGAIFCYRSHLSLGTRLLSFPGVILRSESKTPCSFILGVAHGLLKFRYLRSCAYSCGLDFAALKAMSRVGAAMSSWYVMPQAVLVVAVMLGMIDIDRSVYSIDGQPGGSIWPVCLLLQLQAFDVYTLCVAPQERYNNTVTGGSDWNDRALTLVSMYILDIAAHLTVINRDLLNLIQKYRPIVPSDIAAVIVAGRRRLDVRFKRGGEVDSLTAVLARGIVISALYTVTRLAHVVTLAGGFFGRSPAICWACLYRGWASLHLPLLPAVRVLCTVCAPMVAALYSGCVSLHLALVSAVRVKCIVWASTVAAAAGKLPTFLISLAAASLMLIADGIRWAVAAVKKAGRKVIACVSPHRASPKQAQQATRRQQQRRNPLRGTGQPGVRGTSAATSASTCSTAMQDAGAAAQSQSSSAKSKASGVSKRARKAARPTGRDTPPALRAPASARALADANAPVLSSAVPSCASEYSPRNSASISTAASAAPPHIEPATTPESITRRSARGTGAHSASMPHNLLAATKGTDTKLAPGQKSGGASHSRSTCRATASPESLKVDRQQGVHSARGPVMPFAVSLVAAKGSAHVRLEGGESQPDILSAARLQDVAPAEPSPATAIAAAHSRGAASKSSPLKQRRSALSAFAGLHPVETSLLKGALAQNEQPAPDRAPTTPTASEGRPLEQTRYRPSLLTPGTQKGKPGNPEGDSAVAACTLLLAGAPTEALEEDDGDLMEALCCPITQELVVDPVMAADGFSYERSAIEAWLSRGSCRSPMTGAPLEHQHLVPNLAMRSAVDVMQRRLAKQA